MNEMTVVNEKTGELTNVPDRDRSLVFGTLDPEAIISKAIVVANRLADIVEQKKLFTNISGRKYVRVEGWNAVIAMLGIFPKTVWSQRVDRKGDEIAYEAKVTLQHLSGTHVGEGHGFASSVERKSWGNTEFSIKSMAQTRALGKACRLSFGWIMALAGYESTPFEEMDPKFSSVPAKTIDDSFGPAPAIIDDDDEEMSDVTAARPVPDELQYPPPENMPTYITEKQWKLLFVKRKQANLPDNMWQAYLKDTFKISTDKRIPKAEMETVLSWIDRYGKIDS